MKKNKIKKVIIYVGIILIGVGCILTLCGRAEQVNKMEVQQYERFN